MARFRPEKKTSVADQAISQPSVYKRISYYLSSKDRLSCASVNKTWCAAFREAMDQDNFIVTVDLVEKLKKKEEKLRSYLDEHYAFSSDLTIKGWKRIDKESVMLPNVVYDDLIKSKLRAKRLILHSRGRWDTCKCLKEKDVPTGGKQVDTINPEDFTDIENIIITSTFHIGACTLLDLISRSPNLKTLRFCGVLENIDHVNQFKCTRFYSDLEGIYWPWSTKKDKPVIMTIAKRNENITTFYSNNEIACALLAADCLNNVKHLSLNLNEDWHCKPKKTKKVYAYVNNLEYLCLAKNVEALEVRTYDIERDEDVDEETRGLVERNFEQYKLKFWEKIAKLPNVKYLAVYGAWELDSTCREMAKHGLQIEYLKINLMPNSVITALENFEDSPVLAMDEAMKYLEKLSKLKSLHLICPEKLSNIDKRTMVALKDFTNRLWNLDVRTGYTSEVDELLNHCILRGRQTNKQYSILMHIVTKEEDQSDLLIDYTLKHSPNGQLKLNERLQTAANNKVAKYKCSLNQFYIWGLRYSGNMTNPGTYEDLEKTWRLHNEKFEVDFCYI